jgi:hypothetical protein
MNDLEVAYNKWIDDGEPRDHNGSVDHVVKMFYLYRTAEAYGLKTFVESGTSYGDGVEAMLPFVDKVYTFEAWRHAYDYASNRFKDNDKVNVIFGDSGDLLAGILPKVGPSLFWLDAHYSGDGTAQLDKDTPIVAELEAIAAVDHSKHAIVIDDARGFGDWKDYPTIQWLEEFCAEKFPEHDFFVEGDEIFVVPR